jgi:hypothetical protein
MAKTLRFTNRLLAVAVCSLLVWVVVDSQQADTDPGYPDWEIVGPGATGSGLTATGTAGAPTATEVSGSLFTHQNGHEESGHAALVEYQDWRGTIQNAGTPNWVVIVEGEVAMECSTYLWWGPHADTSYYADARAQLAFEGSVFDTQNGHWSVDRYTNASDTVILNSEDQGPVPSNVDLNDQSVSGWPHVRWEVAGEMCRFRVWVGTNGNLAIDRSDMFVQTEAKLERPVSGTATAFDGVDFIENWNIE